MPVSDLLWQGIELMVLGMGIVFSFLVLLVLAMGAMSAVARRLEGDQGEVVSAPVVQSTADDAVADRRVIAAISAAVAQYRAKHR